MRSFRRQVASKARHNEHNGQRQGDTTSSLSAHEKLSCGFRVPVIIAKVCAAYLLTFMSVSRPRTLNSGQNKKNKKKQKTWAVSWAKMFFWHTVKGISLAIDDSRHVCINYRRQCGNSKRQKDVGKLWCQLFSAWLHCLQRRGLSLHPSSAFWVYCAFDWDHYHDGFIVPGIWQTKSRKWLRVTQGIWRGMWCRGQQTKTRCATVWVSGVSRWTTNTQINYHPILKADTQQDNDEVNLKGTFKGWRVCHVVTCSTVRGEQISSPLRIMERWVNTSDSWKESRPSSSLTLLTTETHTDVHCVECISSAEHRWFTHIGVKQQIWITIPHSSEETLLCSQGTTAVYRFLIKEVRRSEQSSLEIVLQPVQGFVCLCKVNQTQGKTGSAVQHYYRFPKPNPVLRKSMTFLACISTDLFFRFKFRKIYYLSFWNVSM